MLETNKPCTATDSDPTLATANNVDISSCDREQVHLVGAIQPHGALLVLQEPSLRIVQASINLSLIHISEPTRPY